MCQKRRQARFNLKSQDHWVACLLGKGRWPYNELWDVRCTVDWMVCMSPGPGRCILSVPWSPVCTPVLICSRWRLEQPISNSFEYVWSYPASGSFKGPPTTRSVESHRMNLYRIWIWFGDYSIGDSLFRNIYDFLGWVAIVELSNCTEKSNKHPASLDARCVMHKCKTPANMQCSMYCTVVRFHHWADQVPPFLIWTTASQISRSSFLGDR